MRNIIVLLGFTFPVLIQAQDTHFTEDYKPQVAISVVGGMQNNHSLKLSAPVYGFEISMECPLVQNSKSHIRQQFSLMRQAGKKFKSVTAEINPQYKIIARKSFELGIGPSVGLLFTNAIEDRKTLFSYGMGGSVIYEFKKFIIGVESRYALTPKVTFIDFKKESTLYANLNNLRSTMKIGYKLYK